MARATTLIPWGKRPQSDLETMLIWKASVSSLFSFSEYGNPFWTFKKTNKKRKLPPELLVPTDCENIARRKDTMNAGITFENELKWVLGWWPLHKHLGKGSTHMKETYCLVCLPALHHAQKDSLILKNRALQALGTHHPQGEKHSSTLTRD